MTAQAVALLLFGLIALWFGIAVFRTRSMIRSAFSLLTSMAALGAMFLAMQTEFLGVLQFMMMATEMAIMAIFMMMYMMDPGGLGQMDMSHQKRLSLLAGLVAAVVAAAVAGVTAWGPIVTASPSPVMQTERLGLELLSRSMLIFETAGLSILVAMIAATALAVARRRT